MMCKFHKSIVLEHYNLKKCLVFLLLFFFLIFILRMMTGHHSPEG